MAPYLRLAALLTVLVAFAATPAAPQAPAPAGVWISNFAADECVGTYDPDGATLKASVTTVPGGQFVCWATWDQSVRWPDFRFTYAKLAPGSYWISISLTAGEQGYITGKQGDF